MYMNDIIHSTDLSTKIIGLFLYRTFQVPTWIHVLPVPNVTLAELLVQLHAIGAVDHAPFLTHLPVQKNGNINQLNRLHLDRVCALCRTASRYRLQLIVYWLAALVHWDIEKMQQMAWSMTVIYNGISLEFGHHEHWIFASPQQPHHWLKIPYLG